MSDDKTTQHMADFKEDQMILQNRRWAQAVASEDPEAISEEVVHRYAHSRNLTDDELKYLKGDKLATAYAMAKLPLHGGVALSRMMSATQ